MHHLVEAPSVRHVSLALQQGLALHRRPLQLFEVAELEAALAIDVRLQAVRAEQQGAPSFGHRLAPNTTAAP